jgi:hypothetical protein
LELKFNDFVLQISALTFASKKSHPCGLVIPDIRRACRDGKVNLAEQLIGLDLELHASNTFWRHQVEAEVADTTSRWRSYSWIRKH